MTKEELFEQVKTLAYEVVITTNLHATTFRVTAFCYGKLDGSTRICFQVSSKERAHVHDCLLEILAAHPNALIVANSRGEPKAKARPSAESITGSAEDILAALGL